jgi:hypothetical protein
MNYADSEFFKVLAGILAAGIIILLGTAGGDEPQPYQTPDSSFIRMVPSK